ncbi:MAG: hypothetical protein B0A82_26535 [Alkalinema sp. CACIAM 70d]|nr:MAG: hypothetical protein B0A82_26535 [Alkalinema sp. CACIAM 70d]
MTQKTQTTTKLTSQPTLNLDQSGLLQRKCECGNAAGLTGECEDCQRRQLTGDRRKDPDAVTAPVLHNWIQPKLTIGEPNDQYEQEADRVADQVMRMPTPDVLTSRPLVHSNLPFTASPFPLQKQELKEEDEEKKKGKIQAKEEPGQVPEVTSDLEKRLRASQGKGQPLPEQTRSFMEPRFGTDFSQVRVHTDNEAAQMNRAINAQAFTHRQDIYFAADKYHPASKVGQQLVAHELTHVMQQTGEIQYQFHLPPILNPQAQLINSLVQCQKETISRVVTTPPVDSGVKPSENITEQKKEFPPDFNPEEEAKKLYEAFKGWGTDERMVFDVLTTGRQDMTQAIETAYNQLYSSPTLETRLHEELSGNDLERALILLGHGKLDLRDKVREVMRDIVQGDGFNEEKLFHALEHSSKEEINALNSDSQLISQLKAIIPTDEWQFVEAYLTKGKGILAAQLRSAVRGWGTDEKAIWRALEQATPEERKFVSEQEKLKEDIKDDLSDEDWIRFERTLAGNFSNLDRIEMAALGWGTDETALKGAIAGLTGEEFTKLANTQFKDIEGQGLDALDCLLEAELSGSDLVEARETLNQKRLAFDKDYKERYLKEQTSFLGDTSPQSEAGASVLLADTEKGESMSVVGKLKVAAAGAGTDEKAIWHVLNSLTDEQRRFIRERNPEGVLNVLREDLSDSEYQRAMELLAGGATSIKAGIKQAVQEAVEGWGTDKRLLYDAVDRAAKDKKVAQEILADPEIDRSVQSYVEPKQYQLFRTVLQTGNFTPSMRLQWATTAMAGTDEDLVFELCKQYGKEWFTGSKTDPSVDKTSAVNAEVDAILKSELSTSDYWKALDSMRGEPNTEEERLARAKELLERERGGVSTAIMDSLSFTGENADDAWREYRSTYNRALEDGKISKEEEKQLRQDERYSKEMTEEYQEAKSSIAQWATSIAVAIVGIVATILTAGTAGPFVLALGGKLLFTAQAMILAAALKVGLNRAIQGEGYDATSTEALVDAASAGVEVGLSVLGGQLAARFVQGASKTALVRSVGPYVQKAFGKAGTNIMNAGLEGAVDATIGGVGEGVLQGLANEKTWADGVEGFFKNMGTSVGVNALMSSAGGFIGGAGFKSIGEAIGPRLKGKVPDEPTIKAEEPKLKAPKEGESAVKLEEPTAKSEEPTVKVEEPSVKGETPSGKVEESTVKAEDSALKVTEPTAAEATATQEFSDWKKGLNSESQKILKENPALAKIYAEMDPEVRQLLTLCQSCCFHEWMQKLPDGGKRAVKRIEALLKKTGLPGDHPGLRRLLHAADTPETFEKLLESLQTIADYKGIDSSRLDWLLRNEKVLDELEWRIAQAKPETIDEAIASNYQRLTAPEDLEPSPETLGESQEARAMSERSGEELSKEAKADVRYQKGRNRVKGTDEESYIPSGMVHFEEWFDSLTKEEVEALWKNPKAKEILGNRVRDPGGYHEWLKVSKLPKFKEWGVSMRDIHEFRTLTEQTAGEGFRHGQTGSGWMHDELDKMIDKSNSLTDFKQYLNDWADEMMPPHGRTHLPDGLQLPPSKWPFIF